MNIDLSSILNVVRNFFISIGNFLDTTYTKFAAIAAILTIGGFICRGIYKRYKVRKERKSWQRKEISDKLVGFTDDKTLKLIRSHRYIPTMGQQIPPHDDKRNDEDTINNDQSLEERLKENKKKASPVLRIPLVDYLIKEMTEKNSLDKKRYLILGGSGMGKSTFSAALFYKYIYQKRRKNTHPIYIKSLGNPEALDEIKSIQSRDLQQSILILDALDENIDAANDLGKFLHELELATHDFKFVIITCRTQFFEDLESEPKKWTIPISGASSKGRIIKYIKFYLSPFTQIEVQKYIKNGNNYKKEYKIKANQLIEVCKDVLSRPMVLSFMDDLLELEIDEIEDITTVEIYLELIDKWFDREIEIQRIDKSELYSFSIKIALYMYDKWQDSKSLFINAHEYQDFLKKNGYDRSPYSFKTRSLINRTSLGEVKFSHRSFWEFFLAICSIKHPQKKFHFGSLTMAQRFHYELYKIYLNGKKIEKIDFYNCNYFSHYKSFSDPALRERLIKVKECLLGNTNDIEQLEKKAYSTLYVFWEMLLKRIIYQYTLIDKYINCKTKPELTIDEYHYIQSKLFEAVKDCFQCRNIKDLQHYQFQEITKWYLTIYGITKSAEQVFAERSRKIEFKEFLFFPNYYGQMHIPKSIVNIAYGPYDFDRLGILIKYMKYSQSYVICIYNDSNSIDNHAAFIKAISKSSNLYTQKIIARVFYQGTTIDYIIDGRTNSDNKLKIREILQNMIKAKNDYDSNTP